jgi:hypothetical protein
MGTTLRADRLNDEVRKQQRNVDSMKHDLAVMQRRVSRHVAILTRLKLKAKRADGRYSNYQEPKVDQDLGIEWFSFRTAMRYGVSLTGDGWYMSAGRDRSIRALHTRFEYNIHVDKSIRLMLKKFIPGAEIIHNGRLIVCRDVKPALKVAQLVKPPSRIVWSTEVVSDRMEPHKRVYDKTSIRNIHIVRRIGDDHV